MLDHSNTRESCVMVAELSQRPDSVGEKACDAESVVVEPNRSSMLQKKVGHLLPEQQLLRRDLFGPVLDELLRVVAANEEIGRLPLQVGQSHAGAEAQAGIRVLALAQVQVQAQPALAHLAALFEGFVAEPAVDTACQPLGRAAHGTPGGFERAADAAGRGRRRGRIGARLRRRGHHSHRFGCGCSRFG